MLSVHEVGNGLALRRKLNILTVVLLMKGKAYLIISFSVIS